MDILIQTKKECESMKLLQGTNIGEQIKKYRKLKGYSQMDVAAHMQLYGSRLSESSYSKLEQGRRNIYIEDFVILKIILGFEYSSIFNEIETAIYKRQSE